MVKFNYEKQSGKCCCAETFTKHSQQSKDPSTCLGTLIKEMRLMSMMLIRAPATQEPAVGKQVAAPTVNKQSHPKNSANGAWQEDNSAARVTFLMEKSKPGTTPLY